MNVYVCSVDIGGYEENLEVYAVCSSVEAVRLLEEKRGEPYDHIEEFDVWDVEDFKK